MSATYDEVAEWWETSEWFMSTYPPSAWHKVCEAQGYSVEDLEERATEIEAEVEASIDEDDEESSDD